MKKVEYENKNNIIKNISLYDSCEILIKKNNTGTVLICNTLNAITTGTGNLCNILKGSGFVSWSGGYLLCIQHVVVVALG